MSRSRRASDFVIANDHGELRRRRERLVWRVDRSMLPDELDGLLDEGPDKKYTALSGVEQSGSSSGS